ncbi:MAG: tetratricopeptide (TPR) repeat protein [Thermoproteota archaeon]|jgi:tetratricopeptide (TPR) repeat protein
MKKTLLDNKFLLSVCLFLIYLVSINIPPFGDDNVEVLHNGLISNATNPFVFWNPFSNFYKSWPVTYSSFWVFTKIFGKKFFLYRVVNIVIHIFNFLILRKILNHFKIQNIKYISLLFLIHPFCVESIVWIFQFKTLLSTTFFLLSLYSLSFKTKKHVALSITLFTLSLLTKSSYILIPFLFIINFESFFKQYRFKYVLTSSVFLLISLFLGVNHLKGVGAKKSEFSKIDKYEQSYLKGHAAKSSIKTINFVNSKEATLTDPPEVYKNTIQLYLKSLFKVEKIVLMSNSFYFYMLSTFGINNFMPIYPTLDFSKLSTYWPIYVFAIILFVLLTHKDPIIRKSFHFLLLTFLPISGLIFIPYFRFSYIADHWFYSCLPFALVIIVKLVEGLKFAKHFLTLLTIFLTLHTVYYNFEYRNIETLFLKNHQKNPKSIILNEYLAEYYRSKGDSKRSLNYVENVLDFSPYKIDSLQYLLYYSHRDKDYNRFLKYSIIQSYIYFENGMYEEVLDYGKNQVNLKNNYYDLSFYLLSSQIALKLDKKAIKKNFEYIQSL